MHALEHPTVLDLCRVRNDTTYLSVGSSHAKIEKRSRIWFRRQKEYRYKVFHFRRISSLIPHRFVLTFWSNYLGFLNYVVYS